MNSRSLVVAIITAYKPDPGFRERFLPLLTACDKVVVVDNTPGGHRSFDLPSQFIVIQNLENLGLAVALNAGLREARLLEADTVILFDQDSTPSAAFVDEMLGALAHAKTAWGAKCGVGPTHVDDALLNKDAPVASARPHDTASLKTVTCLPTSGLTLNLTALALDETFSDEFFLDLVDFEWCWRLRTRGWTFLRTRDVQMFHRLGVEERQLLGLTFHVPAPYRHYFQVRDTLRIVFRSYVPNYSKLRLVGVLPLKALVYPFVLDQGFERLAWMGRGVWDFVRNVGGIGAAGARLSR